ncbi:hypothetical protein JOC37_002604 [Desulfohalotomaculum tongense]|uniref:hypothetical protein n=1 Tax=Desulforadius tongensis TaxID=1216062 RepID=UPI0019570CF3|nr:hypothetical protein [Desulforadius tongensis]MBM7856171.1 hypothetical protein [Desulforadius tongensis]
MSYIDEYHYYHGAPLAIISQHPSFSSINKPTYTKSRSIYLLNHNKGLYIKHSTAGQMQWRFSFSPEHQEEIRDLFDKYPDSTFIILVCNNTICCITYGEYAACIDENFNEVEWLEVWRPQGGGFRVRGAAGELSYIVHLNRFPSILFT